VPNVITKITGEIAARGLNIENMLNKSKKEYAYTLIDAADGSASPEIIDAIRATEGVIKVRVI
jgi:D-3-phosphoglycerate dehydrogenase